MRLLSLGFFSFFLSPPRLESVPHSGMTWTEGDYRKDLRSVWVDDRMTGWLIGEWIRLFTVPFNWTIRNCNRLNRTSRLIHRFSVAVVNIPNARMALSIFTLGSSCRTLSLINTSKSFLVREEKHTKRECEWETNRNSLSDESYVICAPTQNQRRLFVHTDKSTTTFRTNQCVGVCIERSNGFIECFGLTGVVTQQLPSANCRENFLPRRLWPTFLLLRTSDPCAAVTQTANSLQSFSGRMTIRYEFGYDQAFSAVLLAV